jgi:excisionase family DNA binding protein
MGADTPAAPARGLTVADVAARYRVSRDKVRAWIRRGELSAVNTSSAVCAKPRWVIPPEALAIFERRRAAALPPKPPRRRRRPELIDYYPDS